MCSSSISHKYPRTIGAAYPTTVPHSQSHPAGSPAHLDPACQSYSTNPALRHGVPPGGAMGGLGRQHSCWGDGLARPRLDPGKRQWSDSIWPVPHWRSIREEVQGKICQFAHRCMFPLTSIQSDLPLPHFATRGVAPCWPLKTCSFKTLLHWLHFDRPECCPLTYTWNICGQISLNNCN